MYKTIILSYCLSVSAEPKPNEGEYNFIKPDDTFLVKKPFDYARPFYKYTIASNPHFSKNYALVYYKSLGYNYIDLNGKFLSKKWFSSVEEFYNSYSKVECDGKWNYLDLNGKLLSKTWFDRITDMGDICGTVKLDEKFNFIKPNGTYLFNEWFDKSGPMKKDFVLVSNKSGGWKLINYEGKLIVDEIFRDCLFSYDKEDTLYTQVLRMNGEELILGIDCNFKHCTDNLFNNEIYYARNINDYKR